jgi:DNA invertase Pin-like site-specific DNA recombinase
MECQHCTRTECIECHHDIEDTVNVEKPEFKHIEATKKAKELIRNRNNEIRANYKLINRQGRISSRELAKRYGISHQTVINIVKNKYD